MVKAPINAKIWGFGKIILKLFYSITFLLITTNTSTVLASDQRFKAAEQGQKIENSDVTCLLNWFELNYPSELAGPLSPDTQYVEPYYFRYYSVSDIYIAISQDNDHLYYYAPSISPDLVDLGNVGKFYADAGCVNNYTVTITDDLTLLGASTKALMSMNAEYVVQYINRYVDWKGTLDLEIKIRPISELTWSDADGLLPANGQIGFDGDRWRVDTLYEATTGEDLDTERGDIGAYVFIPEDGVVQNYGRTVWFDPNPQFEITPNIPAGQHDFVSILIHEVFHTLGFYTTTLDYEQYVTSANGIDYFSGERTKAELGTDLQLADGQSDHYISPYDNGLMHNFGSYEQRWEIGRIELAVLEDLGYDVTSYEGLPLFDIDDKNPSIDALESTDSLYGDYQNNTLTGNSASNSIFGNNGNDQIFGGAGNDIISGGSGNDTLNGGSGNDTLDGGPGNDTAVFDTRQVESTIVQTESGVVVTSATAGTDTLSNIEFLQFSDGLVAAPISL